MQKVNNPMQPQSSSGAVQGFQPTKEDLGRYVHDIADLEKRIFTIDKTIQESQNMMNEQANRLQLEKASVSSALENAKKNAANSEQKMKEAQANAENWETICSIKKPTKKEVVEDTRFFGRKLTSCIFGGIIIIASLPIFIQTKSPIVFLICPAIALLLFLIGAAQDNKRRRIYKKVEYVKQCEKAELDYQKSLAKYYENIDKYKQELHERAQHAQWFYQGQLNLVSNATDKLLKFNIRLDNFEQTKQKFYDEIGKIIEKREILSNQMHKMYSFNLIPPDYREPDCVMMFDQIFRNDLADNMREAVKIYEERVFRGDVLRGMEKIYGMLGQLTAGMMAISRNLEAIKRDVSAMSSNLITLVDLSEESVEQQGNILRETELNRYATESVRNSMNNIEYYTRTWYNRMY